MGGLGGAALGSAVTIAYASLRGWPAVVPAPAMAGAAGVTVLVGVVAGLYPAVRASRLAPTAALAGS